jgi:hypothetical protein
MSLAYGPRAGGAKLDFCSRAAAPAIRAIAANYIN